MKTYKYIGYFQNDDNHTYSLTVHCNGFLQAFFLLTADAIRSGKHYQLYKIEDEDGNGKLVDDIKKCNLLLS